MATGLLVCCIGRATRLSEYLVRADKVYEGVMVFGAVSDTYDADGEISEPVGPPPTDDEPIHKAFEQLCGEIEQETPIFSAVKVKGRRLYDYARKGEDVEAPRRKVSVKSLDLTDYDSPRASFVAKVGSGTYIRSICHDAGKILGCGAYLEALRRKRVGYYKIEDASTLDELKSEPGLARERLIPLGQALKHLPRVILTEAGLKKFFNGNYLVEEDVEEFLAPRFGPHLPIQVVDPDSNFYGIMERKKRVLKAKDDETDDKDTPSTEKAEMIFQPCKVFHPEK
jgi:tRNA pseudouridine55 synthase